VNRGFGIDGEVRGNGAQQTAPRLLTRKLERFQKKRRITLAIRDARRGAEGAGQAATKKKELVVPYDAIIGKKRHAGSEEEVRKALRSAVIMNTYGGVRNMLRNYLAQKTKRRGVPIFLELPLKKAAKTMLGINQTKGTEKASSHVRWGKEHTDGGQAV